MEEGLVTQCRNWAVSWMTGVQFLAGSMMGFFLLATMSIPALGPIQSPIQWVPGVPSPGVKRLGCEADHSSPSTAEVKNGGAIPASLHCLHGTVLN